MLLDSNVIIYAANRSTRRFENSSQTMLPQFRSSAGSKFSDSTS